MSGMPGTPRIKPLPENEWDTVLSAVASTTGPLNIFTTLGRHPDLFKAWIGFGSMPLLTGTLPPRDRGPAILRTAHLSGCAYEGGHHVRIGGRARLAGTETGALAAGPHDHTPAPRADAVV